MKQMTLSLIFLRRNDQVLLAMKKRGFGEGRWNGAGGKVEPGETLEQSMIREAEEEIGITPIAYEKVGDIVFDEYFKGEPTLLRVHVFTATKWQGTPQESDEMRPQWFALDRIPYDSMWPDDPLWLPRVLAGKKITATFTLDETDTIIFHNVREIVDVSSD